MSDSRIGRYELVRVLGKGAMGVVHEAVDPLLARRVAIKTIRTADLPPAQARGGQARFLTEARSVARLNHPHIVSVYDSGEADGAAFLVMEYVDGVNLHQCAGAGVVFSVAGAVCIVAQVLDALAHAHGQKIVHRDIKPENILLDVQGRVRLTDFGIAKMLDAEVDNGTHVSGQAIGTPRYMSPEQVRGQPLDERSDLFSTGVVLYELLTGRVPFDGGTQWDVASAILHDEPPAPSAMVPALPSALDAVVQRALAKQPQDRFADAQAFRQALLAAAEPAQWAGGAAPQDTAQALATPATAPRLAALWQPAISARADAAQSDHRGASPASAPLAHAGTATSVLVRRWGWRVGGAAVALYLVLVGWWWWHTHLPEPPPATEAAAPAGAEVEAAQTLSDKEALVTTSTVPATATATAEAAGTHVSLPVPAPVAPAAVALPGRSASATEAPPAGNRADASSRKGGRPAEASPASAEGAAARKPDTAAAVAAAAHPTPVADAAAGVSAGASPAVRAVAEPCTGLGFFARESCLWKQCRTDAFRRHPVCERFQARRTPGSD